MLEVHPPHAAAHSWKDFFLHIATICVGLLIAIGLEQTVEAIHRAHERRDLREELQHESEQILKDSESCVRASFAASNWNGAVLRLMSTAAREHHAMGEFPEPPKDSGVLPSDPIFRGATASNKLALLTRPEVEAFSELHVLVQDLERRTAKQNDADLDSGTAMSAMSFGMDPTKSMLGQATAADLKAPYAAMIRVQRANAEVGTSCYVMHGAAKAISHGERDYEKIEEAETEAHTKLMAQIVAAQKKAVAAPGAAANAEKAPAKAQ